MPTKRKNKSQWCGAISTMQPWFMANKKRQRRRRDIAIASRRRNRGCK